MNDVLFTIGHSNHDPAFFLGLLKMHAIAAVADVRSSPYSRFTPQFSKEELQTSLREAGLHYLFLGRELGGRSDNPDCYHDGRVQYDLLAAEPAFVKGLSRLREAMAEHRVAIMCAEKDPLDCHRALMVARKMFEAGTPVAHVLADGSLEKHEDMESRLLQVCKLPPGDLFTSRAEFVAMAYAQRAAKVAFRDQELEEKLKAGAI
jgi:uncharacterized protein (DUF488 family)